ncbi:hypothetical protein [Marilutibacter aestuarii]|uniref:hypothetical protein n=1 Tax=Marilutibacter aestuarii TaxID=1706195 RepID=UPI001141804B|nr:hypothetical protein [Lysobacter aestuarii]
MGPPAAAVPTQAAGSTGNDAASGGVAIDARPFPRRFEADGVVFNIHQPQYDEWEDGQLSGRFAVSVAAGTHPDAQGRPQAAFDYGVVGFRARTQVDKAARAVVLTDIALGPASFPAAPGEQSRYLDIVRGILEPGATLTLSLDQLESSLAVAAADPDGGSLRVANDPPELLLRQAPAVLVRIDGDPALRSTGEGDVRRVINTRSLVLVQDGRYYLYLAGHWVMAASLDGPWSMPGVVDGDLERARREAVASRAVDTLEDAPPELAQAFADSRVPDISVRTRPAELITTQGAPEFADIPGTRLAYVANTGADVFVDADQDHAWYALVSGRWFSSTSSHGPWRHVAATSLPADFAAIPPESPKSGVLASIPGTPEARESLIANSIPQTASVDRRQAELQVAYDGEPQFRPIEGTALQYAWNTAVPVIRVDARQFYAVDRGIWFVATSARGPWRVADSVPAAIYAIPTTSPLHYVTYVRVYGGNGDEVYVGYTPGYYGTVVSDGVVVYGTGYDCDPWLGTYWYGCPATYGLGAYFGWNPWVGWTFGWGWGWGGGWYGPYSPWWGPWYGPAYPWGWWGGGAAAWNVYGHWGTAAVRGTAAAWANPWTGNYGRAVRGGFYDERSGGRGMGRAAVNTNAYTGTTRARAEGLRYNPQTGRVVSGEVAGAGNPYSGRAGVAGDRTVVNTGTGRVTESAGAAVRGPGGAAGAGGFDSDGNRVDVAGAGGFHYNADSGSFDHGGAIKVNDSIYAGRDGNVYRHGENGWEQVTRPGGSAHTPSPPQGLDRDRVARERGQQRINGGFAPAQPVQRPASGPATRPMGPSRPMGGFRGGLGGRPRGGGFGRR